MNKAHIKYLENHLYILANESKRYELVNSNIPAEVSISEMDCAEMDEFIDNIRLVLGVLGHKILEPSIKRKSENSRQPKCPPEKEKAIRDALEYFRMI